MQPNVYKETRYPIWNLLKSLYREGKLSPEQALFAGPRKPVEELYDIRKDPDEVYNLADDPAHAAALDDARLKLDQWLSRYPDHGAVMEEILHIHSRE